jgi:tRNA(Ile)-lysidine synthase
LVARIKGDTRGITFKHVDSVCTCISEGPSKVVQLPQGLCVWREYGKLIFTYKQEQETQFNFSYDSLPESVVIEKAGIKLFFNVLENPDVEKLLKQQESGIEFLDFDKIRFPLAVRSVLPGDKFFPLGMEHSRKLKDFFIDLKIPVRDRSRFPLLVSGGKIACLCGLRIDDRFKLNKGKLKVLEVRFVRNF